MEGEMFGYDIIIGEAPALTYYASRQKMEKVRRAYDVSIWVKKVAEFKGDLSSLVIKVKNMERANLALSVLGLPQGFLIEKDNI